MRRWTFIIGLVLLLLSLGSAFAVTLQQGWYAEIDIVGFFVWNSNYNMNVLAGYGLFTTPLGQYLPFDLTDGPGHVQYCREAVVNSNLDNVGPADSLILPMNIPLNQGDRVSYLTILGSTNYDPTIMRLEFWNLRNDGTNKLIWAENRSGQNGYSNNISIGSVVNGSYYFKINVVPEPNSIIFFIIPTAYGVLAVLKVRRS